MTELEEDALEARSIVLSVSTAETMNGLMTGGS